ncbi:MAG: hypothetical protein HY665_05055 [Chloroflexi bacterium]|nr:hypothetical protein [Chloroflexota bacterium]
MNAALQTSGNILNKVTISLTRRDIVLMNFCLGVVAREHARGSILCPDIESLQTRLAQYQPATSASEKKQCGENSDLEIERLPQVQRGHAGRAGQQGPAGVVSSMRLPA